MARSVETILAPVVPVINLKNVVVLNMKRRSFLNVMSLSGILPLSNIPKGKERLGIGQDGVSEDTRMAPSEFRKFTDAYLGEAWDIITVEGETLPDGTQRINKITRKRPIL